MRRSYVPSRSRTGLTLFDRKAGILPGLMAASQREHVLISHFFQVERRQGGTRASAAIQDNFGRGIGDPLLNVPFDDSPPQMNGPREMPFCPFAFFADVNE